MRCLTLATALQSRGYVCHFVMGNHPGNLAKLVLAAGMKVHLIELSGNRFGPRESACKDFYVPWLGRSWEDDAKECVTILRKLKSEWLVVDHYSIDRRWESKVSKHVRGILVIDDLADREHHCDILVDQNLGHRAEHYKCLVPADCSLLTGPEYALLRPEFRQFRQKSLNRRGKETGTRILICMGGADGDNVTGAVVDAFSMDKSLPSCITLDIVMGPSSPWIDEVRSQVELLPCRATLSVGVNDMAQRMCDADLCIGGSGTMSWERCCIGVPSLVFVLADNQKEIAESLVKSGAVCRLELPIDIDIFGAAWKRILEDRFLAKEMSARAAKIVDGLGCRRVITRLFERTAYEGYGALQ